MRLAIVFINRNSPQNFNQQDLPNNMTRKALVPWNPVSPSDPLSSDNKEHDGHSADHEDRHCHCYGNEEGRLKGVIKVLQRTPW